MQICGECTTTYVEDIEFKEKSHCYIKVYATERKRSICYSQKKGGCY